MLAPQPFDITSGEEEIEELADFKPKSLPEAREAQMVVKYLDGSGRRRVKGGADLKSSQSYPIPFHS